MRFRGREKMSVDAKGRTSMPARFREILEETYPAKRAKQLVLVPWFDGCIRVFPVAVWDEKQAEFDARFGEIDVFQLDEDEADLRRFIYGLAQDVQLDSQGRILLGADARDHAGVEREVYWIGIGPVLEIWAPEKFNDRFSARRASAFRKAIQSKKNESSAEGST
jgi:MraZ protein